jgi:hypothetical protein
LVLSDHNQEYEFKFLLLTLVLETKIYSVFINIIIFLGVYQVVLLISISCCGYVRTIVITKIPPSVIYILQIKSQKERLNIWEINSRYLSFYLKSTKYFFSSFRNVSGWRRLTASARDEEIANIIYIFISLGLSVTCLTPSHFENHSKSLNLNLKLTWAMENGQLRRGPTPKIKRGVYFIL